MPRACGASSTPRPIRPIIPVSGILDHPLSHARVMTAMRGASSGPAANVLWPGHEFPPLLSRRRHHRRRRRRPRRRQCAEGLRPLHDRAGSPRPPRRPRPHHQAAPDVVFDLGCGWLHSAHQNSFAAIAGQLNFELNKDLPPWRERAYGKAFPQAERDDFMLALDEFYHRLERAAQGGKDGPANHYLEPGNRWNAMIDAISTYVNGCELDQLSILDFDAYEDSNINWRVRRGYGALVAAYGAQVPIALNCEVRLIDHSAKRLR